LDVDCVQVILLGAHPEDTFDVVMQVTIAYNHFASGLIQRMPRCRFGYFHIVNNDYTEWQMYAIGGSESPTILSEGNRFTASNDNSTKEARLSETLLLLLQRLICKKRRLSVKQKYIIKVHFLSFPLSMTLHLNENSDSAVLCTNQFLSTRM
jgi:hypothetical protein